MQQGDYQTALPMLESAVQQLRATHDLTTAYANYNLGVTLIKLGRCDEAMPYLEASRALQPHRHEVKDAISRAPLLPPATRGRRLDARRVREPLGVLPLVVGAVLAGLDRLPPVAPVAVPLDGRAEARLEVGARGDQPIARSFEVSSE